MHKFVIKIRKNTDISSELENFEKDLLRKKIAEKDCINLISQVSDLSHEMASRGVELNSVGSEFQLTREINSHSCKVILDVYYGSQEPSILSKIFSIFLKR